MKKLFLIVAALFAAVSFNSCSKDGDEGDDNGKEVSIVGEWPAVSAVGYEIEDGVKQEFNDDLTGENLFMIFEEDGYGTFEEDLFKYRIISGKLYLTYVGEDETNVCNIAVLSQSKLVLEFNEKTDAGNEQHEVITFVRM